MLENNNGTTPPTAITKEQFVQSLEGSVRRIRQANTESFKMSEIVYGNIVNIYARIGEQYFHLCDTISLKHDEIIAKVKSMSSCHSA